MKNNNIISSSIITCYGCGVCKLVCPTDAIQLYYKNNDFQYAYIDNEKCVKCKLCFYTCPSTAWKDVLIVDNHENTDIYKMLQPFHEIYFCHSNDPLIRKNGASGGMVATTLKYMLENKYIDGALIVGQNNKLEAHYKIVNSVDEIKLSQKSKYFCVPLDISFKTMKKYRSLAFVGLPCHLEALNNACLKVPSIKKIISYKIGLFCAHVQTKRFYRHLLKQEKMQVEKLTQFEFRTGDWWKYNYFRASTNEKRKTWSFREDKYLRSLIVSRLLSREACLFCPDFMGSKSDISFGDGWHPKFEGSKNGFNYSIIRSKKGFELFELLKSKKIVTAIPSNPTEFYETNLFNTFMYKHFGIKKRLCYLRRKDKKGLSNINSSDSNVDFFKTYFYFKIKHWAVKLEDANILHKFPFVTYLLSLTGIYMLRDISLISFIKSKVFSKKI